ncbi:MAG: hypothetical protein N4A74_05665 [Carboxylicivirga sp.]|nr:hypothetical protein [Carboxylicivirga sp.]
MKNYKLNIKPVLLVALTLILGFYACDDNNNYINPKELIAAEQELLDRYYNEIIRNDSTRLQIMTAEAIDTIDLRLQSGLLLFHTEIGTGDSVKAFKEVGFRYSNYGIILQNDTVINGTDTTFVEKTAEALRETNKYGSAPFTFRTFPSGSAAAANANVYLGVNEAIMHMKLYGKAKVVMPSTLADNQFNPHIFEIDLTYLEQ